MVGYRGEDRYLVAVEGEPRPKGPGWALKRANLMALDGLDHVEIVAPVEPAEAGGPRVEYLTPALALGTDEQVGSMIVVM